VLNTRVTVTNQNVKHQVLQLRSVYVILKDHEQELCITLCMWSLLLIARQGWLAQKDRKLLDRDYVKIGEAQVVLPEDARVHSRPLEALPRDEQDGFLPRLLMVAYNRFGATRSVQDAAEAVRDECEFEAASMDTKLSMVRFTAWAIPAVGFVGTVRGIGAALQEAQGAMGGDISGVTMGLGITFNATLTALVATIIVMFWMHQLQQFQDRLVLDARTYVDRQLLRKLRVVSK
jgi:biopolymer transport protein ExbB/TolQ